jgi:acyl-coenzyme A thioesterase PaaI-like protein
VKRPDLYDDGYCFACGRDNPSGLSLDFRNENGKTVSSFTPLKIHQGFKDIVHGGIITTILDEAMMKAVLSREIKALTAEIYVRFKSPLMVGDACIIEAEIKKMGTRLIETSARLIKDSGTVVAEAEAKLFRDG